MYHPRTDVTHNYQYIRVDFVKHLAMTTLVIAVLTVFLSAVFHEPVYPTLRIADVATSEPLMFYDVAFHDLAGTGEIAQYGPPYNHGTAMVQSPMQRWIGILHPVNVPEDFVLRPLRMAAHLDPSVGSAVRRWSAASPAQQRLWLASYQKGLARARMVHGRVVMPFANYGPVSLMIDGLWQLAKSGLMSGALDRSQGDYQFDNQNFLLFLQGRPLHHAAARLELKGNQWGIIHEERAPYPGPWWMTIVTAIYQIPYISHATNADALALGGGMVIFIILLLAPWIPVFNGVPRHVFVHRLIWRQYYRKHPG